MKNLEIYTDGSSLGNPGPGGWGVVVVEKAKFIEDGSPDASVEAFREIIKEIGGHDKDTTNNRMELTAAIEALKYLCTRQDLVQSIIYTDSTYVLGGVTSWINNWERNGWKTANKKPVLNKELWLELVSLARILEGKISWQKVKGHSGHVYNDKADEIATNKALLQK